MTLIFRVGLLGCEVRQLFFYHFRDATKMTDLQRSVRWVSVVLRNFAIKSKSKHYAEDETYTELV